MGCVIFVPASSTQDENTRQDTFIFNFLQPWMNGDDLARTVLKTVPADDRTAHDFHTVSEGRTMASIWEISNSKRKVQEVYIAVTTFFT